MKNKLHFIALGALFIALLLITPEEQARGLQAGSRQMDCDYVVLGNGFQLTCFDKLTPTAVPTTTHTRTPLPPTVTSVPPSATHSVPASPTASQTALPQVPTATKSATPPVSPTAQPPSPTSSGNVSPFASAPECQSHDNTAYHGLWNPAGCHYDHTHNDNPSQADSIFGVAGREWGQSVSYPFMTDNENSLVGHTGYKYYVNLNPQPACANDGFEYLGSVNCVSAFRIQYHDVGGNAHMVKRFHSYYMEVQLANGGIVRTGGWADFGCLHGEYKKFFVTLPGIDPTNAQAQSVCQSGVPNAQNINSDPYRAVGYPPNEVVSRSQQGRDNPWGWTSFPSYGWNKIGFFFFRTLDSAAIFDPASPYTERLICPDFKCKYNNSEHHMYSVHVIVPASLDTNGDGLVTYTGYTDRRGTIVQGCTSPSLDCIPLQIVNAPVGRALWARNTAGIRPPGDPVHESDIYFNGVPSGWIEIPVMP